MSYCDTWELPPAGIDKIEVRVHPALIARFDAFHRQGNINASVQLRQPRYSIHYYIEFHAEYFNPFANVFEQIITYLTDLALHGILKQPINTSVMSIAEYLSRYFNSLFFISEIEFFFDFKETDMYLNPKNPCYSEYNGNTAYSSDFKKGDLSSLCAYNRIPSLQADCHAPRDKIGAIPYTRRIEFRLTQRTCAYLHPNNLRGDYHSIVNLYKYFLARKWLNYGGEVAFVPQWYMLPYASYFNDIVSLSEQPKIPRASNFLDKTPKNPILQHQPKQKEADKTFFARITTQNRCEHSNFF
jgi:hypothetical protein